MSFSFRCKKIIISSNRNSLLTIKRYIEHVPAVHQKIAGRKRFYKHVDVNSIIDPNQNQNLYEIRLHPKYIIILHLM